MKKITILAGMIFFIISGTFAGDGSLFTYDKSVLETEMASLNELEQFVLNHPGVTLSELNNTGHPLAVSITETDSYNALNLMYEKALGIGGFWWGCCLGPAGILVVYLVSEDKAETKKSVIGCVVGSLLYSGSWAAYYWGLGYNNNYWW